MHVRELFDLTGQVALVTGASAGLGRQMALALAEAGADLCICARGADRLEAAAAELRAETGRRVLAIPGDVSDPEQVEALVQGCVGGLGRLDVLVNNAGIATAARPERTRLEDWRQVMDINATGTFLMCRAAGQAMMERGGGRIINIVSVAGLVGSQAIQALPYAASKGAIIALTRDLAAKWGRKGIRVNALAPGFFPTDLSRAALEKAGDMVLWVTPLGRLGGDDDLKGAVVFLASRASEYITGQVLAVDGGLLAAR